MILTPAERDLVESNMGLVYSVAQHYHYWEFDREDIVAYGMIGLIQAAQRYDSATSTAKFSTFAYQRIRGAIVDGIRRYARVRYDARCPSDRPITTTAEARPLSLDLILHTTDSTSPTLTWEPHVMDTYREDNHFPEHLLEYAMSTLTDRERYVIERFYFDNKILDVIGKELGVSKSRATQLRISGLAKLRRQLVGRDHLDIKDFDFDSDSE